MLALSENSSILLSSLSVKNRHIAATQLTCILHNISPIVDDVTSSFVCGDNVPLHDMIFYTDWDENTVDFTESLRTVICNILD